MSFFRKAGIFIMLAGCSLFPLAARDEGTRLATETEAPPRRRALLIGNSSYNKLNRLKNPANDVDKLAAKLRVLQFQVDIKHDLGHDDFVDALNTFSNSIVPGDIALFYYSGHGVQFENVNYLIPVNMPVPMTQANLQGLGISLPYIRNTIMAEAKLSIIILDACRTVANLPAKGAVEGLAAFSPRGTLVAYAADEGQAASDNDTEDVSLFTKQLINTLDKPDMTLCQLFGAVREAVDTASHNLQFPFVYDGVIGEFIFNPKTTPQARELSVLSHTRGTKSVWDHIEASLDPNYFAAFLSPVLADSTHHEAAEARLSSLMSSTAQAVGLLPLDLSSATPEEIASANQGERLFDERVYGEALKSYQKMLTLRPSDASMLYDYATCLLHLGRYDEGIQAYSKAIELNPTLPWTYFNRGVAYHLKGDPASAIIDYVRGLQSKPAYAQGYNNLALAQRDLGDLQNADLHAGKAADLDPYYAPSFFNWARILLKMGNQKEALSLKDKGEALTIPKIGTHERVVVKSEKENDHHL